MKINISKQASRTLFLIPMLVFGVCITLLLNNCGKGNYEKAVADYGRKYYASAAQEAELVSRTSKDKQTKINSYLLAANANRMANDYASAVKFYDKYLKYDPKNAEVLLFKANCLKNLDKNQEAFDAYTAYLQEVPGDSLALNRLNGLNLKLNWNPDSSRFKVENFKEANTKESDDWAPMISASKDKLLYFATDREGGVGKKKDAISLHSYSDIWYMEKTTKRGKESWSKPAPLETTNTKFNDGAMTFNARFSDMYITQCNGLDGKGNNCMIYSLKKAGKDWIIETPLNFCLEDTAHFYGHPALSPDGTQMYFASNREGGYGGFDIWVSNYTRKSKSWDEPVNLGPNVNTAGNELYPYFNIHDTKLYFSSDGWPTAGGLDIFKITPTEDATKWLKLQNLKLPINSGGDDLGITFNTLDPNKGYFSSNRGSKKNNFDIYKFYIEPCSITIQGIITDCKSKETLPGATVLISNNVDTSKIRLKSDATGAYFTVLPPDKVYTVQAFFPERYYFESEKIAVSAMNIECGAFEKDICLKSPFDELLTLPIFYDLDQDAIRKDAETILDNFAQGVLLKYPKLKAELGSHTDCRASAAYNEDLASRRAKNAVSYLVTKWKIDSTRIQFKGYGERELVNACSCEPDNNAGLTPYEPGITKKMIAIKENGQIVKTFYENYKSSEIIEKDGKQFVQCDESQHQQNRRTTVRFNQDNIISRVKVNQNTDANNAKVEGDAVGVAKKPAIDISYAGKARIFTDGGKQYMSVMVNNIEAQKFQFDPKGKYTAVTAAVAAEWLSKKMINKGNFTGEKLKIGKIKLPGDAFSVDEIEIGGQKLTDVKFKIVEEEKLNGADAILGNSFFRSFKAESYIEGEEYILIPKKAPRPVREKTKKETQE